MLKRNTFVLLVAMSAFAAAGAKYNYPVSIVDYGGGFKQATGAIGTARGTADNSQYIGCTSTANMIGAYSWAMCSARDANGVYMSCYSYDQRMIDAVASITPMTYFSFSTNPDDPAECGNVTLYTHSYLTPPQ